MAQVRSEEGSHRCPALPAWVPLLAMQASTVRGQRCGLAGRHELHSRRHSQGRRPCCASSLASSWCHASLPRCWAVPPSMTQPSYPADWSRVWAHSGAGPSRALGQAFRCRCVGGGRKEGVAGGRDGLAERRDMRMPRSMAWWGGAPTGKSHDPMPADVWGAWVGKGRPHLCRRFCAFDAIDVGSRTPIRSPSRVHQADISAEQMIMGVAGVDPDRRERCERCVAGCRRAVWGTGHGHVAW